MSDNRLMYHSLTKTGCATYHLSDNAIENDLKDTDMVERSSSVTRISQSRKFNL